MPEAIPDIESVVAALREEKAVLETTVARLRRAVKDEEAVLSDLSDQKADAHVAIARAEALSASVPALTAANQALKATCASLQEQVDELAGDVTAAEQRLREAEVAARKAEAEAQEWGELMEQGKTELHVALASREAEVASLKEALDLDRKQLEKEKADVEKEEARIASRDEKYQARNADLKRLEKQAGHDRRATEAALKQAEADRRAAAAVLAEAKAKLDGASLEADQIRSATVLEVQRERAEWSVEKDGDLKKAWAKLEAEKRALSSEWAKLKGQEEGLRADQVDLEAIVEQKAGKALIQVRRERDRLQAELAALSEEAQSLRDENLAAREAGRRTRGRDIVEMDAALEAARKEAADLAKRIDALPTPEDGAELDRLRAEGARWREEREAMVTERSQLREMVNQRQREAADHAERKREATFWKAKAKKTQEQFDELTRIVNRDHVKTTPFARCSQLDADASLRQPPVLRSIKPEGALPALVDEVRRRLQGKGLTYDASALRLYLAGLSMSRLVLLQGPPGTGKTTLAREFATSIGAAHGKIDVQPGWRDRHDLVGHYNPFERQFNETDFLEHLYRALTPHHKDCPYFIVLDEMNLSRPEYYFADFLGGLEDQAGGSPVWVPLTSRPFADLSDELREAAGPGYRAPDLPERVDQAEGTGVRLPLPSNVWFVGTANQDESTLMPAPRTIDRAHVQELSVVVETKAAGSEGVPPPNARLGVEGLEGAFGAASTKYKGRAEEAIAFFTALQPTLEEHRIGWTPRLRRQVKRFVPVYVSTAPPGASEAAATAEAVDHLLTTKVLYKAEGKFHIRKSHLDDIRTTVKLAADEYGWDLAQADKRIERIAEGVS